jgi:hypothetical protein
MNLFDLTIKSFWKSFKSFRIHIVDIFKEKGNIKDTNSYQDMIIEAVTYCDFVKKN